MTLDEALQVHEEHVGDLLKSATRYVSALKAWQKACAAGHLGDRQKAATQAGELAATLPDATAAAAETWTFDAREWLESGAWRDEIRAEAAKRHGLRVLDEEEMLVSSPVLVRAQPGRGVLQIGKENWPRLRPRVVVEQLKKLRERSTAGNSQQLLDSLHAVYEKLGKGDGFLKLREAYDQFCVTPGWKKENPPAAFAQALYALHRSGITTTRRGATYQLGVVESQVKERDVFTVIAEDGRTIRYYKIEFYG